MIPLKKLKKSSRSQWKTPLNLFSVPDKPEVIICGGEIATTGVLQAVFSKKLRIPEDVHIISISEQESLQFRIPVPVDVLVQSFSDLAREATMMLYEILKGKTPEPRIKYLPVNCLSGKGIEIKTRNKSKVGG